MSLVKIPPQVERGGPRTSFLVLGSREDACGQYKSHHQNVVGTTI